MSVRDDVYIYTRVEKQRGWMVFEEPVTLLIVNRNYGMKCCENIRRAQLAFLLFCSLEYFRDVGTEERETFDF